MSRGRVAVLALGVLLLCGAPYEFCAAREAAKRVQLAATYRVEFGAFNLGDFHLTATLAEPKYELKAKGKFSFISGMVYRASGQNGNHGKTFKERRGAFPIRGHLQGWQQERGAPLQFRQWRRGSNFHRAIEKAKPAYPSCYTGSACERARSSDGGFPVCAR